MAAGVEVVPVSGDEIVDVVDVAGQCSSVAAALGDGGADPVLFGFVGFDDAGLEFPPIGGRVGVW